MHMAAHADGHCELFDLATQGAITDQQQFAIDGLAHDGEGADEVEQPLAFRKPDEAADDDGRRWDAELGTDAVAAGSAVGGRHVGEWDAVEDRGERRRAHAEAGVA